MGNRQKRRAKLQDRITERKAEAIAFPSKYAQKTQPAAKPSRRLSRPALTAMAIIGGVLLLAAGGGYMILSSGAHSPASIVHQLGVARH